MKFQNFFSIFVGNFCSPGSGSESRFRILWPDWIRIRVWNMLRSGALNMVPCRWGSDRCPPSCRRSCCRWSSGSRWRWGGPPGGSWNATRQTGLVPSWTDNCTAIRKQGCGSGSRKAKTSRMSSRGWTLLNPSLSQNHVHWISSFHMYSEATWCKRTRSPAATVL